MPSAARSLMLPPGFRNSSLANTDDDDSGARRASRSMGVWPTSSVMSAAMRREGERELSTAIGTPVYRTAGNGYFLSAAAPFLATRTTGKYPVRVRTVSLPSPLASAVTCTRRKPGSVVGLVEW